MHNVIITEDQFHRLVEGIKSDFGSDTTPGGVGSEVITSPIIDGSDGDKEFSDPVNTDKIAKELYPQRWGSVNGRYFMR